MLPLIVKVLNVLVLSPLLPPINKADHWLLLVGGTFGISKYDVNDGVSLTVPESPNYDITPGLISPLP